MTFVVLIHLHLLFYKQHSGQATCQLPETTTHYQADTVKMSMQTGLIDIITSSDGEVNRSGSFVSQ